MSFSFPSFRCQDGIWNVLALTDARITLSSDGLFLAIVFCQVALSLRVVSRGSTYRPTFIALTCAIITTIFSLALDIAAASLQSSVVYSKTVTDVQNAIGTVQNVAQCFAEILIVTSAFLAMRTCQTWPNRSRLENIGSRIKDSLDAAVLFSLVVITIVGNTVIMVSSFDISAPTGSNFRLPYRVLYSFAVLDLTVTAWYLRSRVAKSVERHDQVIDSLACLVSPLLATNLLAIMAMIGECDNSVWTFSLIEKGLVPVLTFTIFLSLGLSPSVWKSGEDETKRRWSL